MSHGVFCWNELATNDLAKAKSFYGATVGWTYEEKPMPNGSYWLAKVDGKPIAGMMDLAELPPGIPPHWFAYLAVDDVDARLKGVVPNGGRIVREPFDIPDVGRIAVIADVTGAVMGWITPKR